MAGREQVDQLIELMTEEKDTLTTRISELEVNKSCTARCTYVQIILIIITHIRPN